MLISEWAEENIVLAKGTTPRPGPYIPEPFQRIIMDAICPPEVRKVTVLKSTQVGWTQILFAIAGYYMDVDPKPIGLFFPREQDAKDKSVKSLTPMIENSPALRLKVTENRSRKGGNTQQLKTFPGGFLKISGTNTGAGLRSDPLAVLLEDERDGWVADVDGEGNPGEILQRRTDAYVGEEKILLGSTPAKPTGQSETEESYQAGNRTQFHVPCPFCSALQPLLWRDPKSKEYNFYWDLDRKGRPIPSSVRYRCQKCRKGIPETQKQWMLERVLPVAEEPEVTDHVSFYIWAAYSPWGDVWGALAKEWVEAKGKPEKLRAFINLRLGQTWNEGARGLDRHKLEARREHFDGSQAIRNPAGEEVGATERKWDVPRGACVLVCTVDVQAGRIEVQVTAFGPGEEQWLIDHEVFYGSPLDKPNARGNEDLVTVWAELDKYLLRTWRHECGQEMRLDITLIDTGYAADACYDFIQPRQTATRRVFACKGVEKLAKLGLAVKGSAKNETIRLFSVNTTAAKDRVMDRLDVNAPGPAYVHLPYWVTGEYIEQLTAEQKLPVKDKKTGKITYQYVMNQARNEALDLTVYAHGGLWVLQKILWPKEYTDLAAIAARLRSATPPPPPAASERRFSRGIE